MLPKLPLGIAVDLETLAVSGMGDFYLLSIAKHSGSSPGVAVPCYLHQAPFEPLPAPLLTGPFPQVPCGVMPLSLRAVFPSLFIPCYSTTPFGGLSMLAPCQGAPASSTRGSNAQGTPPNNLTPTRRTGRLGARCPEALVPMGGRLGARSLQALPPLPGRSEEPGVVVPGTPGGCSYLNHNQEADGEEEEEEAFHPEKLSAAVWAAAFGDELRAVCRPLWAWLLLKEGKAGRRGEGKERRASGVGWVLLLFYRPWD